VISGIDSATCPSDAPVPICPICSKPLETTRQREGLFYPCRTCDGRAMTVSQVRHMLGDQVATKLLRFIKLSRLSSEHSCPFCGKPMLMVNIPEPRLELESCRACSVVWFDLPTYESLPQMTSETTNSIPMQATEIIALNRLKELKKHEEEERRREKEKKRLRRISGTRLDEPFE
jgi:Zn-finger nucleic acid-binding protein